METRAKLPKKVLSMFLSLLMALSCFSVALPAIAPDAKAATANDFAALKSAFEQAYDAGKLRYGYDAPLVEDGDDYLYEYNDPDGYYYKIAEALFKIVNSDYASYKHHELMRDYIKNNVLGLNDYQKEFIDNLLPIPDVGNYNKSSKNYHNSGEVHRKTSSTDWYPTPGYSYQDYVSGTATFIDNVDVSIKVIISRDFDKAMQMECPTVDKVPASLGVKITYSVTAKLQTVKGDCVKYEADNGKSGSDKDEWDQARAWTKQYYENEKPGYAVETQNCPDLSGITNYVNYVSQQSFLTGYNAWRANSQYVYTLSKVELEAVVNGYTPYKTAVETVDEKYRNQYMSSVPKEGPTGYDAYVNACNGVASVDKYADKVAWILDGAALDGFAYKRDDYQQWTEVRNPENKAKLDVLLKDATALYNELSTLDDGMKEALYIRFQYTDERFESYLKELKSVVYNHEATDMYDEIVFRMTHDETECLNGEPDLWGALNYLSYPYTSNGEECPVTNEMLEAVTGTFNGYLTAFTRFDQNKPGSVEAVFNGNDGGVTYQQFKDFVDELNKEVSYRGHELKYLEYFSYFEGIRHQRYHQATLDALVSLTNTAGAKSGEFTRLYNDAVATFGEERAKQIYGNKPAEYEEFVDSLITILYDRTYQQHKNLLNSANDIDNDAFDGTAADEVNSNNFSAVKRGVKNIDEVLYNWVLENCSAYEYDLEILRTWHALIPQYNTAVEAIIAQAWTGFNQVHNDIQSADGTYTGVYVVREPLVQDMVREFGLTADNYIVTKDSINQVIGKLDSFITSEAFMKLIGMYRENEETDPETGEVLPAAHNLTDLINNLLQDLLFQDEMINTIISALFPMVADLIGGLLVGLFDIGGMLDEDPDQGMIVPPDYGDADGAIGLELLEVGYDLAGNLNLYINGKQGTAKLSAAFHQLGLSFYPYTLAAKLEATGKYKDIVANLKKAGEDWNAMDLVANGGNGDGELTVEDFENYSWGVTDYNSFCAAIGDVFSSILPLLQVLFTNYTYQRTAENLAYLRSPKISAKMGISASIDNVTAYGDLELTLNGVQGYNNIWATLFETLGISGVSNAANYTVTIDAPLHATFGTSADGATAGQFANCLFMPLLSLIDTLSKKPLDTLMSIIPNLMQSVAYGFVQPILGAVKTTINVGIRAHDFNGDGFLGWLLELLEGVVSDAIYDNLKLNFDLNLGSMLDLEDLLGVDDLSDINGIIDNFLVSEDDEEAEDEPAAQADDDEGPKLDLSNVSIPDINAGRWASLGEHKIVSSLRAENFNDTTLGAGKRHTIVADKADMLYEIINWLLTFISIEGNLSGLLETFGAGELPVEIDAILSGIDTENALAALVELFLPKDYALEDYDWYQSNEEGSRYNFTATDFVYLKYANNWTREKAEYLYNNVDAMANTIVNMIDPELLKDYNGNVNLYLQDMINSMFNNEGIMNVIDLVNGIGEGLAGEEMIVNLVKEQISSGGADTGVDLLTWYKSFGYLTYDYTPKYDEETGELIVDEYAPLKPGEAGYVNEFPALSVEVKDKLKEDGSVATDDDGNAIKEYFWYVNGTALVDGAENAREVFTEIFCELLKPLAPIVGLLFTGTDLGLFNKAIVINGAECYKGAIIPVYEMLGIYDLYTQEEYTAKFKDDSAAGFEYLVNKLFDRVTELLTIDTIMVDGAMVTYGPIQKIIDLLPQLFYFIQSDGISTLLKNLIHPIWNLIDTIRPIADVNLDAFIHQFLAGYLGLVYDKTDMNYASAPLVDLLFGLLDMGFETPEYSDEQAAEDKALVDGIFKLSIEKLNLEAIYFVVEKMFGFDLSPLSYALEGMCLGAERDGKTYGVREYDSKTGDKAYTLDYDGPDTLTVTFSAIFDLLTYGDNAAALDKMLGFVKEVAPEDGEGNLENVTAAGILEAVKTIFEDKTDSMGEQPNWDYLLEGKIVNRVQGDVLFEKPWVDGDYQALTEYYDLSIYHSINNLEYLTDWTEDTAKATDEVLKNLLDFIVPMLNEDATSFDAFVAELLETEVFHGDTLKALAGLIADLFEMIPPELISIIDTLLDTKLQNWGLYVQQKEIVDEEGAGTGEYEWLAREDHKWWADPEAEDFIDSKEEFLAAVTEILTPAAKLLGVIFLGTDYRLFYTIENGPGSVGYGDDAIVINGLNAYAKGIVPIFEALGLDLTNYKPEKYEVGVNADGDMLYNEELFIHDFVEIISNFVDMLIEDPVNWLIETLPGLIYFINANGISTSLMNIVDSLVDVLGIINGLLDEDKQIDLTNIAGIDLTNITFVTLLDVLSSSTGIYVRDDLKEYLRTLYVGGLKAYTSASGITAFTMEYSSVEERHDMITILLSLVLEIVTDEGDLLDENGVLIHYNNAEALDALINGDDEEAVNYVSSIVGALKNPDSVIYKEINWNYFDETIDLTETDEDGKITVPGYAFQYLNYTTDWTYTSASKTAEGFEDLILSVLRMTEVVTDENATLSDALKGLLNLEDVFTGETLQSLLDLVRPLLFGEDAVLNQTLIEVIGAVLGADLTQWNNEYAFETKIEGETYEIDPENGLSFRMADIMALVVDAEGNAVLDADGKEQYAATGEQIKTYGIETRDEFITGATVLFAPAYRLLSWLLFGEGYEFFNGNTEATAENVLITIPGTDGYREGLSLLLEALGCKGLGLERKYKTLDENGETKVEMELFVRDLAVSLFARIDEILNNPVNEIVNLLPELLYFINAGGLQVSIANLVASPLNLVNMFAEISGDASLNIDALLENLLRNATENEELTFTLDGINLQYIFEIVEMFTGLEITDVVGNKLAYFHMGEIVRYTSAGGKLAYKMRFSEDEDFADFITILLSFVIDVALWDGNAAALEELIGLDEGLVQGIVKAIKESYTIKVKDIDWFYFDENIDTTENELDLNDVEFFPGTTTVDVPERTINYIEYASDWNEQTADYVFQNRNEIIAAVLSMTGNGDTTLAEIIANSFSLNEDLYTAENLNAILDLVAGLSDSIDAAIINLLGIILNVDLSVYNTMERFTDDQITNRTTFVQGLYQVLYPVFPVLDWILFGDDLQFFDKDTDLDNTTANNSDIQVLINLPGAEGFKYALVPLLEALGVTIPEVKEGDGTAEVFYTFANNLLARAEAILANPVDEALALLPNLIYFINANGISVIVNNLAGGVLALLDTVNEVLPDDQKISIEKFLADALDMEEDAIKLDNLDLLYLLGIVEEFTGLEIIDVVSDSKIDKFYLGQMTYYTSANGKPAFRMEYSATEGGAEMLTIIVNLLLEVALYKDAEKGIDNIAALETLLDLEPGTVNDIIDIIPLLGAEPNYVDFNWNYMGGEIDPVTYDITLPKTPFMNYFTYKSDVTQKVGNYFYDNLDQLVLGIMRMCGVDETLEEMVAGSFNLYQAEYLNAIVDLTKKLYDLLDARLIDVAGMVLGIDVSVWDGMVFTDAEIYDAETFAAGLTEVISPVFRVLDWLLFGDSYEFFVKNEKDENDEFVTLLKIEGNQGYKYGLAPILEAIGVDLPTLVPTPTCATMFRPVIDAVLARYDEIMANLIDEAVELLPNLLYFINANGLSVAVRNLAGSVLNIINVLNENGIADIDLKELLFGLDIENLDLEAVFTLLEELEVLGDFEFNNAFKGYTTENADGTVTFVRDVNGENIIKKFYLGDVDPYISSTGELAYKMQVTDQARGDLIIFILSFAVDAVLYGDNAGAIERKFDLDEGIISNIAAIFAQKMEFTPADMNWVYFLELSDEELDAAIKNVLEGKLNELPELPERTLHYIEYDNNWNEATAEYLVDNLPDIVDLVIAMATDYASLNDLINGSFNLYTNENVNMIVEAVAGLLNYLDEYVLNHAGVLLNVEVDEFMSYRATNVTDKASFVKALATAFGYMGEIVDLVLFGEDLELFTHLENGEAALLTATGGEGWVNGLAPLLAALGVDTNIGTIPAVNGDLSITEQVIETILMRIADRIDEILANPVDNVFDILLNLFYFINADGLTNCVSNLLQPATYIMEGLGLALGNDYNWDEIFGFAISDLSFEGISKLLKDATGIDLWGAVGDYLGTFYFGELKYYEYAEGKGSFRMVYTDTEEAHDFITIVLSVVLDTFVYPGNKDALVELFGEDGEGIYNTIMAFLTDSEVDVPMKPYQWLFTDKADTGYVFSPVTGDGLYDYMYGELYTREMGEYITKWLPSFIDTMIVLLGVEDGNGGVYDGLQDIFDQLIGTSIYKTDLLVTIADALKGLVGNLKESIGEELFTHIANILNSALGVNVAYWDNYTVTPIAEGDKDAFINGLLDILTPAYPLLAFLLTDEDLAFFNKDDGIDGSVVSDKNSYVIIHGAEGYAYGIIPILEALGYDNDKIMTPEEYKAAAKADPEALLRGILDPILARVDEILADPIDELLGILPGVVYFINSDGLTTAVDNTINAVLRVLETIEPITGEIDLYELLGFSLDLDIEGLIDELLTGLAEDTGFQLTEVAMEAVTELTLGEVISFTSKNGDEAYTMIYSTGTDTVDFVTVVLRLVLTFISIPENVVALEAILADELTGDGYTFLCSLLENFSQMAASENGMDEIMYTVYQIFYAANVAAHKTNDWLEEFNGDYTFLGQLFETSDLAFMREIKNSLGGLLNKYTPDIITPDEGVAPNGFIKFFQKIAEFFQKIADFFKNLFS